MRTVNEFEAFQLVELSPLENTDERVAAVKSLVQAAHQIADRIGADGVDEATQIEYDGDTSTAIHIADWLIVNTAKVLGFEPDRKFKDAVREAYVSRLALEIGLYKNVKLVQSYEA